MGKDETELQHIDIEAMRMGPQLNMLQRESLIKNVTEEEIQKALAGIGDLKSLGMDGFGSKFFKACWHLIKHDVIVTVKEYFDTGQIYKAFNSTVVTLIPKGEIPKGYGREGGTPRVMMQIDLQKAYDMVNWRAMECILKEIGIAKKFIDWILASMTTISYKGIQFLPSCLFLLWSICIGLCKKMQNDPNFNHHPKCAKLNLTNLIFADDVLLFCRGDPTSVEMMQQAFSKFIKSTGLIANPSKSTMFCGGIDNIMQRRLHKITGFKEGVFPVKYLRVPLTCKRLTIQHYLPLIDKILARIHHWTAKLLTYAGRIQLVKSIISGIAQYRMSCFPFPKIVLAKIDRICRSFIWTGTENSRKSPVEWSTICKPYAQGGLQILNLQVWNHVLMLKCLWNICRMAKNLWVK
ncbi:uncharacterized protein LOC131605864 [Vicia villosa]|uniref:uncharacterized protein LOC131605864 n=1 Tax=Vicia villosa TaxID=3911 RepID=UPI00273C494F|nr:uncharacterized protein LOC131605864 [Vicia villosa]